MKEKKFKEHSKLITDISLIGVAAILLYSMVIIAITQDTSSLTELIIVAGGIGSAALGFYMWRAKAKDKLEMYRKDPEAFNATGLGKEEEIGG